MTPADIAKSNSESAHQKALFAQVAINMLRYPAKYACLRWLHAIPNGGARDIIAASKFKAEGVKAGVSDIFLPLARKGFHGLYIEMKKPGKIKDVKPEQQEFINDSLKAGYQCCVCDNWEDAWYIIDNYVDLV